MSIENAPEGDTLVTAMAHALERGLRKLTRLDEDVRRLAQDVNALRDEPDPLRCSGPDCRPVVAVGRRARAGRA